MPVKATKTRFVAVALLIALSFAGIASFAQPKRQNDEEKRKEWMTEMRSFKHEFFKKELGLNREQENAFFKAYDQMDDELIKIGEETRSLERKITSDPEASETEMESAARTLFEQKKKEADVELKYFEEFKTILNKRQLLKLKETERRFNRALLNRSKGRQPFKD